MWWKAHRTKLVVLGQAAASLKPFSVKVEPYAGSKEGKNTGREVTNTHSFRRVKSPTFYFFNFVLSTFSMTEDNTITSDL